MSACGTRSRYVGGCRCDACRRANNDYRRQVERHKRRVSYGIEAPKPPTDCSPDEARAHLLWLRSVGVGRRTVAAKTGLSQSALQRIAWGDRGRIKITTANRILAVGKGNAPAGARVDAAATWRLINDMVYLGAKKVWIAEQLGNQRALQIGKVTVLRRTASAIARAWDQQPIEPWHGTYAGYAKRSCRCIRCRDIAAEMARQRPEAAA